jgi:hypothetical protein
MEVVVLLPLLPSSPTSERSTEKALLTGSICPHPRKISTPPMSRQPSSLSPAASTSQASSPVPSRRKHSKRVTIELSRNRTHVLDENLCSCADDIWYPADHFAEMKAAGKRDAREGRRMGLGALLGDTFAGPGPHAQDCIAAFCRLDGSSAAIASEGVLDDVLSSRMNSNNTSRRGLERSLSRRHGDERSEMKDRARRAVLIHQTSLTRQGAMPDEITEKIAAVYRKHCRSARLFARRFGIADEMAVAYADDPTRSALQHAEARQVLSAALGGSENSTSCDRLNNKLSHLELFGESSKGVAMGGRRAIAQRRFSNASLASSTHSVNSYDSNRRFCGGGDRSRTLPRRTSSRTCPTDRATPSAAAAAPLVPSDELYVAAIA